MLSYEEIKQRVKSGYTTQNMQTNNEFETIKQDVKNGKYDFGVDENYINTYLTDAGNYLDEISKSQDDITYAGIMSRYNASDDKRAELLAKSDKITAYLNSHKSQLKDGAYEGLSASLNSFRDAVDQERTNLLKLYSVANNMTEEEFNNSIVSKAYKTSTYNDIVSEINALKQSQKSQTGERAARTQQVIDLLSDRLYTTVYRDDESYNQAFADLDKQISELSADVSKENSEKIKSLEAQKTELKRLLTLRTRENNLLSYGSLQNMPEFSQYADEGSKMYTVSTWGTLKNIAESYEKERVKDGFGDQNQVALFWAITEKYPELLKDGVSVYDVDNDIAPGTAKNFDRFITDMKNSYSRKIDKDDVVESQITVMDDTEKAIYNAVFAMGGSVEAQKYLAALNDKLNLRKAEGDFEDIKGDRVKELLYSVKAGLNQFGEGTMTFLGGNDSDYVSISPTQYTSAMIREDLPKGLRVLYDLGVTTTNMAPPILVSMAVDKILPGSGNVIGSLTLGASASGNAYNEAVAMGYDQDQAKFYSYLVGGSEAGLQYILGGVSKLGGKWSKTGVTKFISKIDNAWWKAAANLGVAAVKEGFEEYLQEVISPVLKNWAFNTNEDIELLSSDALYAGLLGALSGGVFEGANVISDAVKTNKAFGNLTDKAQKELVSMGLSMNPDSEAFKVASKYVETIADGKGLSATQAERLTMAITDQVNKNREATVKGISEVLKEQGETKNLDLISNAILNKISGIELSEKEASALDKSTAAQSILNRVDEAVKKAQTAAKTQNSISSDVDSDIQNGYNDGRGENDENQDNYNAKILGRSAVSTAGGNQNSIRKSRENTSMLAQELGISTESNAETAGIRAGSSGWFEGDNREQGRTSGGFGESSARDLSGVALNETDSAGRKLSDEVREELSDTAIKDEDGTILSLFHWTDAEFDVFEKGDIGFHFGTLRAAIKRRDGVQSKRSKGKSFVKEVYLNIKNPVYVDSDPMNWDTFVIAYKLNAKGVFSDSDISSLQTKEGFIGGKYGCEAVKEFHRILQEKGYDGIIYENAFEGGLSVIAINPDQIIPVAENGVLKENSGVSAADSNESASFMPENVENSENTDLSSRESIFGDVSGVDAESDSYENFRQEQNGTKVLTEEQQAIKSAGEVLGIKVEFKNLDKSFKQADGTRRLFSPNGYFNKKTNTLYINSSKNFQGNALETVFKHELTHFAQKSPRAYKEFVDAAKKSKVYEKWLREKTKSSDKTIDIMEADLRQSIRDNYRRHNIILSVSEAENEMLADFVGDVLFEKGGKSLNEVISSASEKQKPKLIQAVLDMIHWLREKFKGDKNISFELIKLESKYKRALREAKLVTELGIDTSVNTSSQNKNSTEEGGGSFSIVTLDSGKSFVKASRKVINGDKVSEWRSQISSFFNKALKNGPIEVKTIEGDILTINRETAKKARAKTVIENGVERELTDNEFLVKLHAETHIDELAEMSTKNKKMPIPDTKNHRFAKDGFTYRTVYFQDFDGSYYKVSLSIGENNGVSTIYNVGKIKADDIPDGNVISTIGSKADMSSTVYSISNSSENVNTESDNDVQFSVNDEGGRDFTAEMEALSERYSNGEIDKDTFMAEVDELFKKAGETYGTIKKGETVTGNENFDNPTPESVDGSTKVRQHVRTIIEGGGLTEEMLSITKQQILSGDLSYEPTSNEANMAAAVRSIENNTAESLWKRTVDCEEAPNAKVIATGEALLKLAVDRKDTVKMVQLVAELSEVGTRAAQTLQAFSLLKRMDGIGQLYYVQRCVDTLNRDLHKRFKTNPPEIKINESLATQLAESKTADDFAISYAAIMNDIAAQVPSTFLDKWNAWRYISMLANPTTHVRNVVGNAIFVPAVKMKDIIATGIEHVALRGNKASQRTKSAVVKKEYKDFAKDDYKNVQEYIEGSGKMNPKRNIADDRKIFTNKALEALRTFNGKALEAEDAMFLKAHYQRALGGYLQAQGVNLNNVDSGVLAKAREYAILEAKKATYRDESALANMISRASNSNAGLNVFIEGVLPFKKTPINIVKRGVEYSPLGLAAILTKGVYDLKTGKISASQFIDGISAGLTGSFVFGIGAALYSLGIIRVGFGDDEEDWYNKMMGMQEYSVEIGGLSYTIDWAAPSCIPFFMGATMMAAIQSEDNSMTFADVAGAFSKGLEPIIEFSMLSGIRDTISSARYTNKEDVLNSIVESIINSYLLQAVPTVGTKISNLVDPTRRTNYVDKTSATPELIQNTWNKIMSKIPGLSYLKPEYVNAWGETEDKGNFVTRFFQNFLSPGYISSVEVDDIDVELKRLAKETGDDSVFPDSAAKKIEFKGYTKNLKADEYVEYATLKGQLSADYINELMHNEKYNELTDEQKVEVINNLYEFANAKVKSQLSYSYEELNMMHEGTITRETYDKYSDSTKKALAEEYFLQKYKKPLNWESNGESVVEYYIVQAKKK